LLYLEFSWSHDPGYGFRSLTWVDPICCCFNFFFKKRFFLKFVLIKQYFYQSSRLSLDPLSDQVISVQLPFFYLCLKFELQNFKLVYFCIWIEIMFVKLIFWYIYIYIYNSSISKRHTEILWNWNILFQLKKQNANQNGIDNLAPNQSLEIIVIK
jgi:hypothetical protein